MPRKLIYLAIGLAVLAAAFWGGIKLGQRILLKGMANDTAYEEATEQHLGGYKYINPLLECNIPGNTLLSNPFSPFEREVRERIQYEVIVKSPGIEISVYVRNLMNGPWFGINEYAEFSPASLLKVPLMMSYYKNAERDSAILQKKIKYEGEIVEYKQEVPPEKSLEIGQEYTVKELIERMIVYSDNQAMGLLVANISSEDLVRVYKDFALKPIGGADYTVTVKGYSTFFRTLYNASYLTRDYSEGALELLTNTKFEQGLVSGVPADITVAHKFGERFVWEGSTIRQLHDCGIVYHPRFPYLLCIMTRGLSTSKLNNPISEISRIVYEEVEERYPRDN